jgi:hypothetical protein
MEKTAQSRAVFSEGERNLDACNAQLIVHNLICTFII